MRRPPPQSDHRDLLKSGAVYDPHMPSVPNGGQSLTTQEITYSPTADGTGKN